MMASPSMPPAAARRKNDPIRAIRWRAAVPASRLDGRGGAVLEPPSRSFGLNFSGSQLLTPRAWIADEWPVLQAVSINVRQMSIRACSHYAQRFDDECK